MGKQCDVDIKIIKAGKKKCKIVRTTLHIYRDFVDLKNIRHDVNYSRGLFNSFFVTAQQNTTGDCKFSMIHCLFLCVIGSGNK